ncbi:MAG: hypothetical protein OXG78_07400 [Chloroflexi bacterium]|nr:hypothetical protein [Chloroflexota bacterium]
MIRLVSYAFLAAVLGAVIAYLLAEGLPEGAFVGGLLGASIGIIIAMRRASGGAGPAFEYEAAGIHDDNLITTARRNLVREAYRETYDRSTRADLERRLGSARGRMLADANSQSELSEQFHRLEYGPKASDDRSWLPPQDKAQAYDLQMPRGLRKRKRKPKRRP